MNNHVFKGLFKGSKSHPSGFIVQVAEYNPWKFSFKAVDKAMEINSIPPWRWRISKESQKISLSEKTQILVKRKKHNPFSFEIKAPKQIWKKLEEMAENDDS